MLYRCNSFPKTSVCAFRFFAFSSKTGVPVKPKKIARGNVSLITASISPNVDRCASSTIKTIRFLPMISMSFAFRPPSSSRILLIFWMEVTIRVSLDSSLFNLVSSTYVFSVACTDSFASANARYSFKDCVPSSIRSVRNTTLSASSEFEINCADLNDVMVFPDPVVCQMYPPRCFPLSHFVFETTSEIAFAA